MTTYSSAPPPHRPPAPAARNGLPRTVRSTTCCAILLVLLASCGSPLKTMSLTPPAGKHTAAFWSPEQWRGEPAPFQHAIAQGFRSQDAENYLCRLVEPDLDSVRAVMRKKGLPHLARRRALPVALPARHPAVRLRRRGGPRGSYLRFRRIQGGDARPGGAALPLREDLSRQA